MKIDETEKGEMKDFRQVRTSLKNIGYTSEQVKNM